MKTPSDKPDAAPQNSFVQTLCEIRKGRTVDELSDQMAALIGDVIKTGRKGALALTLIIKPSSDGETVFIDDDVSIKTPKMARQSTTFFVTEDNRLTRKNPRQEELNLSIVPKATTTSETAEPIQQTK